MMEITNDPARIDVPRLHTWLRESYWAPNRTLDTQVRAIESSLNFTALQDGEMVGFARVISDFETFAWLCDVIVDPACRGNGIGKALVEAVVSYPSLKDLRRIILGTKDAHELYRPYGFEEIEPGRIMARRMPE